MSEPDFDQIARVICEETPGSMHAAIAKQLRQVWNARGAADREALGVELRRAMHEGGGQIRPEEILTALDR